MDIGAMYEGLMALPPNVRDGVMSQAAKRRKAKTAGKFSLASLAAKQSGLEPQAQGFSGTLAGPKTVNDIRRKAGVLGALMREVR